MKGICVPKNIFRHLLRLIQHICTRLSVKRKLSVSILHQRHKCQRSVCLIGTGNMIYIDSAIRQLLHDLIPKRIPAKLRQHYCPSSKSCIGTADVGRGTSYLRQKAFRVFDWAARLLWCKVNQRLPNRY